MTSLYWKIIHFLARNFAYWFISLKLCKWGSGSMRIIFVWILHKINKYINKLRKVTIVLIKLNLSDMPMPKLMWHPNEEYQFWWLEWMTYQEQDAHGVSSESRTKASGSRSRIVLRFAPVQLFLEALHAPLLDVTSSASRKLCLHSSIWPRALELD